MSATAFDILKDLAAKYPPRKDVFIAANIDDALDIFRGLRKAGFNVKRVGRTSSWAVRWNGPYGGGAQNIYIDRSRTLPRGEVLMAEIPIVTPPELRFDNGGFTVTSRMCFPDWFVRWERKP